MFSIVTATAVLGFLVLMWRGAEYVLDRTRAPNLDLTVVQSDRRAVAFFDVVFGDQGLSDEWSFADPHVRRRGRPLIDALTMPVVGPLGPHDLLGFRNETIPRRPDIVVLGDSQTYGINALETDTWPRQLAALSGRSVYSMALPGWTGLSYVYAMERAAALTPKLFVVAFYLGNDLVENAILAYSSDFWEEARPDASLVYEDLDLSIRSGGTLETVELPGPDARIMPFQTANRYDAMNPESRAVRLGAEIQASVVAELAEIARRRGIALAVLAIPTKESLYAPLLARGSMSTEFQGLVAAESGHLRTLQQHARNHGVTFLDVAGPLRSRLDRGEELYPYSGDGHPSREGYHALAGVVWAELSSSFPELANPDFWHATIFPPGNSDAAGRVRRVGPPDRAGAGRAPP